MTLTRIGLFLLLMALATGATATTAHHTHNEVPGTK